MHKLSRSICLDICDYTGMVLCNIYDSAHDIQGQAVNVFVHSQRNGFKELTFELPSTCNGENGPEKNYRLDYLINDYQIKLQVIKPNDNGGYDYDTDWFLVSESKVTHDSFSKNVEVRAGHISQLLKIRNLDLEFSDEDGNNTGTIQEIARTILEGTGWHIQDPYYDFLEDPKLATRPNQQKIRSFVSPAKTGAFKMMNDLCEKFDAKPVYHGEGQWRDDQGELHTGRTVEIVPMNPFSENVEEGAIPEEVLLGQDVIELYYDKNIKDITRTLNTDNLVTSLRAYGSYGDRNGICTLQTAKHTVLHFAGSLAKGKEYRFNYLNSSYYFTPDTAMQNVSWSALDFVSRSYVYSRVNTNNVISKVYKEPNTSDYTVLNYNEEESVNYFPFVMDFSYYQKIGLLTDEMLHDLADYQINEPYNYIATQNAAAELADARSELLKTAMADTGFMKLHVAARNTNKDGNVVLTLDTSLNGGVIYRSDYDESPRNYFGWRAVRKINNKGLPISSTGAVIYIIHPTDPISWEKVYVRAYGNSNGDYYRDDNDNTFVLPNSTKTTSMPATGTAGVLYENTSTGKLYTWHNGKYVEIHASDYDYGLEEFDQPLNITLWSNSATWHQDDIVYMFSSGAIAGLFGPREDEVEANIESISSQTKIDASEHPLTFVDYDSSYVPQTGKGEYEWYYKYSPPSMYEFGKLYFRCDRYGDTGWAEVRVSFGNEYPARQATGAYNYYYHARTKMLYRANSGKWVKLDDLVKDKQILRNFAIVVNGCMRQERLLKGLAETYTHVLSSGETIPIGNYAIQSDFGFYWLFKTDKIIRQATAGDRLVLTTNDSVTNGTVVYQDNTQNVIIPVERTYDVLDFPNQNILKLPLRLGQIDTHNAIIDSETLYISDSIYAYENTPYVYSLPTGCVIAFYSSGEKYLGRATSTGAGSTFTTPTGTTHFKVCNVSTPNPDTSYIHVQNYDTTVFSKDQGYRILSSTKSGKRFGLKDLMQSFIDQSDDVFINKLSALKELQQSQIDHLNALKERLGDLYREGFSQDNEYVGDDENRLYADTLDNLKEISHPEATYEFSFLDLYGQNRNVGLSTAELGEEIEWPDIEITYAAHLVDTDIDTNCWAYIDDLNKCYDQPQKTTIEINTRLSMIGQQSFTDVLARIAEVAKEVKANQTLWQRGSVLTGSGKLAADRLEGAINANKIYLTGGTSNWYTDDKGNIIFEASDGQSAMMLTGRGFCVSDQKDALGEWVWRTFGTGRGFTADEIVTGYLSAERIEAGSIQTDKLSSTVGNELEISSNKAVLLCATKDGSRPSGGLYTPTVASTDSYIQIGAQTDATHPAYVNVMSGGIINIGATGSKDSVLNLMSGGAMNIQSGSTLDIKANSEFLVDAPNFKIKKEGTEYNVTVAGNITATSGNIAGFTIGSETNTNKQIVRRYMYAGGANSVSSNANGVYIGTDGINITANNGATYLRFNTANGTSSFKVEATQLFFGSISASQYIGNAASTAESNAKSYADTKDASTLSSAKSYTDTEVSNAKEYADGKAPAKFSCSANTIKTQTYKVGDVWINTDTTAKYAYVCKQVSSTRNSTSDWALIGSAITGAYMTIDPENGKIELVSGKTTTIASGGTIEIASSKTLKLSTAGNVQIGYGGSLFTVSGDNKNAYIYNGKTSITDSTNAGIYLGTDGIYLGNNSYYIKASTATNGAFEIKASKIEGTADTIYFGSDKASSYISTAASNAAAGVLSGTYFSMSPNAGTITINSGKNTAITTTGTITIGNSLKTFTIGATGTTAANARAYIYSGTTSTTNTTAGVYLGTDGLRINGDGSYIMASAGGTISVSGTITTSNITATGGTIGGWTLGSNYIGNGPNLNNDATHVGSTIGMSLNGTYSFWAGGYHNASPKFGVTNAGKLIATDAEITGKITTSNITATGGKISGWNLGTWYLYSGTGTACVCLSPGTNSSRVNGESGDYAYVFWAGADWPDYPADSSNINNGWAPVKITKNGTVACRYLAYLHPEYLKSDGKTYTENKNEGTFNHYQMRYIDLNKLWAAYGNGIDPNAQPAIK